MTSAQGLLLHNTYKGNAELTSGLVQDLPTLHHDRAGLEPEYDKPCAGVSLLIYGVTYHRNHMNVSPK